MDEVRATAMTQGVGLILDYEYDPPPSEWAIFQQANYYMYSVLLETVHTLEGRGIVREFRNTFDGRKALFRLERHY